MSYMELFTIKPVFLEKKCKYFPNSEKKIKKITKQHQTPINPCGLIK